MLHASREVILFTDKAYTVSKPIFLKALSYTKYILRCYEKKMTSIDNTIKWLRFSVQPSSFQITIFLSNVGLLNVNVCHTKQATVNENIVRY